MATDSPYLGLDLRHEQEDRLTSQELQETEEH